MFLWRIAGSSVQQRNRRVLTDELRALARQYQVPRLRNAEIAKRLRRRFAALRIYIAWKARKPLKAPRVAKQPSSESLDPITLERPESPYFDFVQHGKRKRYTARVLIDYMLSSNQFNEPTSNVPFSDADLGRLDAIGHAQGWRLESVLERRRSRRPEQAQWQQEMISVLELEMRQCTAELVEQQVNPFAVRQRLAEFALLFAELHEIDRGAAALAVRCCIDQFRNAVDPHFPPSVMVLAILHNFQV
jgi:hypothetical protein